MKCRSVCCAIASLSLAATHSAAEPADLGSKVDQILHKHIQPNRPGAAVLVVQNGKVVHSRGYGLADLKAKTPVTPQTVFDLASCSKQFTAMAVMILHDHGKLDFDDDIRKHLPRIKDHDPNRPIRIRELLQHTSGLRDYLNYMDVTPQTTNAEVLKAAAQRELAFPTGTKYRYCNTNYALLGLIVEQASERKFAEFLHDEIFSPLKMQHTRLCAGPAKTPDRARGYGAGEGKKLEEWDGESAIFGDGSIFTTLDDMVRWDAGLRAGQLVRPETLRQAWTSGKLDNGKRTGYGFGWNVQRENGKTTVWHNGEWGGFTSYICRYVDADLTVVVLTNCDEYDPSAWGEELGELYLAKEK